MFKVILLISILFACAYAQSFPGCPLDSSPSGICCRFANVFNSTSNDQVAMMTQFITDVVLAVAGDSVTGFWFNGTNDPTCFACDLNAPATQTLLSRLIQFFGSAMGCNATGTYTGSGDLSAVHTAGNGFVNVSVNKKAFEHFNFQVVRAIQLRFLKPALVGTQRQAIISDVQVISSVLDAFRKSPGFSTFKTVCNSPDCVTSPYTLWPTNVGGGQNFYAPTYISVPINFAVTFVAVGGHTFNQVHTLIPAGANAVFDINNCDQGTNNPATTGATYTLSNSALFNFSTGLNWFDCNFHCGSSSMFGIVNVLPAVAPPPTPAPTPPPTPAPSAGFTAVLSNFLFAALLVKLFF